MLTLLLDCDHQTALRAVLYSLSTTPLRVWLTTSRNSGCRTVLEQRRPGGFDRCFEYPRGYPVQARWCAPVQQLGSRYVLVAARPVVWFPGALATVAAVDLGPAFTYRVLTQLDAGPAPPHGDVTGEELSEAPLWVSSTTLRRAWQTSTPWVKLREITTLVGSRDVLAGVL